METQRVTEDTLPARHLALNTSPPVVPAGPLPSHAAFLRDRLDVMVALGRHRLGRGARAQTRRPRSGRTRRHRSQRPPAWRSDRATGRLGRRHQHHGRSAWRRGCGRCPRPGQCARRARSAASLCRASRSAIPPARTASAQCCPSAGGCARATLFALLQASLGIAFDPAGGEIRFDNPRLPLFLDAVPLSGVSLGPGDRSTISS